MRVLRDTADAEDATQQAMLRAWRRRASCRTPEAPVAWCVAIAHNEALRLLTQRRSLPMPANEEFENPPDPIADRETEHSANRIDVRRALAHTPEAERRLVFLRYVADYSNGQIAEALGISEATTRVNLHRARKRLKLMLEPLTE
jgi:RNA polymerase sigma-70 factor, ECF subfamily